MSFGGKFGKSEESHTKMIGTPDILVVDNSTSTFFKGKQGDGSSCADLHMSRDEKEKRISSRSHEAPCKSSLGLSTPKLLIVEGNIGVGKTTLARKLATELNYSLFLEPTTENPFLEKFYADPHKYALKLQLWILQQRYLTYVAAVKHILSNGGGAILDRSVYSDCVFASVCHREGFISIEGYEKYQYWQKRSLEYLPVPHITIYLEASPQCCYDRIHHRARECESGVSLDYLQKLHEEYLTFINGMRSHGTHILKYDWSIFKDEKTVLDDIERLEVKEWIQKEQLSSNKLSLEFPVIEEVC